MRTRIAPNSRVRLAALAARREAGPVIAWFFGLVAFLQFFPNPGLPIGNATGLQLGQVLAALSVPFLLLTAPARKQMVAAGTLIVPLLLSGIIWVVAGPSENHTLMAKSVTMQVLSMMPVLFAGSVVRRGYAKSIVIGSAAAILVHSGFAIHQFFAFQDGEFPFLVLFQNPSFLQPTEEYALWIKRITGLFPEPSALAAACGPWIVVLAGLAIDTTVARKLRIRRRALISTAVLLGVAVVVLSGTGYAILLFGLLASVGVLPFIFAGRHLTRTQMVLGPALVACAVFLYWVGSETLQSRVQDVESLSWGPRLQSMVIGLSALFENPLQMLFGVGPGVSFNWMAKAAATASGLGEGEILAVWSIHVRYISETGLLGAIGIVLSTGMLAAAVIRSGQRLLGWTSLVGWLISGWLTTSYFDLEPIWMLMGLLLSWDRLFPAQVKPVRRRMTPLARAA